MLPYCIKDAGSVPHACDRSSNKKNPVHRHEKAYGRNSNGQKFRAAVGATLSRPVSRQWKGYWQRAA
jgi:hypothetical protein